MKIKVFYKSGKTQMYLIPMEMAVVSFAQLAMIEFDKIAKVEFI